MNFKLDDERGTLYYARFQKKKNPLNQKIDNKKDNYTPPPPPKIESGGKLR